MLRSLKNLESYKIRAADGKTVGVGHFFLDEKWNVRYLSLDIGGRLFRFRREVLLSANSVRSFDWVNREIMVLLPKHQIERGPVLDGDRYLMYLNDGGWWAIGPNGMLVPGGYPDRMSVAQETDSLREIRSVVRPLDLGQRSSDEIIAYGIRSVDGADFGNIIEDLTLDDEHWMIRYLVIRAPGYGENQASLIATDWISRVSWDQGALMVPFGWDLLRNAPRFDRNAPIARSYEERIYNHYRRPFYWDLGQTAGYGKTLSSH